MSKKSVKIVTCETCGKSTQCAQGGITRSYFGNNTYAWIHDFIVLSVKVKKKYQEEATREYKDFCSLKCLKRFVRTMTLKDF